MSTPPKPVPVVQGFLAAAPGKQILLVEGPNDKAVYSTWLKKLAHPNLFSAKVVVESVGNKQSVFTALEWFRDHGGNPGNLFGLVDRDDWEPATIAAQAGALPQLRILPGRDSLDSFFTDPHEIEPSLLTESAAYAAQIGAFRVHLETALPSWLPHWALFMTTERVKERMNAAIYPGAFHATVPIPPDADIEKRFESWANLLAHPQLFKTFDTLRTQVLAASTADQFRSHVSSKRFIEAVVHPAPDGLQRFLTKTDTTWRFDLAENAPVVPADIAAVLQPLLV